MRGKSLIWIVFGCWFVLLCAGFLSSQSTWHQLGGELNERLGPTTASGAVRVDALINRAGVDRFDLATTYARFDPARSSIVGPIFYVPPNNPTFTNALLFFGTWALVGLLIAVLVTGLWMLIASAYARTGESESIAAPLPLERQYGDRAMVLFLIGLVLAIALQVVFDLTWASVAVLVLFSVLALQRYLNRQRLERFKVAQLVALVVGLRNQNRTEVANVAARVNNELAEQRRMTGKLWVSAPASVPLSSIAQVVTDTQAYIDKAHEPREQLAIELERWRVQNQYDYARHVREIKRLAIDNQQKRWELITREVTELRKVMVAATEEVARNPALGMRLQDMFMHINEFQTFMEDLKAEGRMDDSRAGQMMDELFSRTFEAQVDELLKPNRSNGAGAFSRN